jgi:hypothetical protein
LNSGTFIQRTSVCVAIPAARSFFHVPLREQGGDRFLFLPNFAPWPVICDLLF